MGYFTGLIVGLFLGLFWGFAVFENGEADLLIECQKDLPRSQQCALIAVPEDSQ